MALTQAAYRFGVNDGDETSHTWLAAQNADPTAGIGRTLLLDTTFLLRFGVQNATGAQNNIDFTFQYQIGAGGWVTITTSSAGVKAVNGVLTDGGNTTNRLTGLSGTFVGLTGQTEDGTSGGASMDIASSGCAETICALQLVSAGLADGDVVTFKLLQEGADLGTYSVTPTLTIVKNLNVPTLAETVKIADTSSQTLNPLNAATLTDPLKIAESLTAVREPLEPATAPSEALKITDVVTASCECSVPIDAEALKIADAVTAARDLTAALSEGLTPTDAALAEIPSDGVTISEALRVTDTVTTTLIDLEVWVHPRRPRVRAQLV